jgi:GLPGLI family protein
LPLFSQNYRITYGKSNSSTQEDLDKIKDINVKNNIISINQSFDHIEYELLVNDKSAVFQYVKKLKLPNFNARAIIAGGGEGIHYYDQKNKNEIFEVEMSGKKHYIKSSINKYKWEISNDTKVINDFVCYRANTMLPFDDFRGKGVIEVEVWFCPEFPLPYGPDIYFGLPGLVFEANQKNSKIKFYLKKIEKLEETQPIKIPDNKTITEDEFTTIFNTEMKNLTDQN